MSGTFRQSWDVLVLLSAFIGLAAVTTNYSQTARQFPLIFLVFGAVALAGELLISLAPSPYGERLERLTKGLTSDMETFADAEEDGQSGRQPGTQRLVQILVLLPAVVLSTYLFGFVITVPLIVAGATVVVGSPNWRVIGITTVVLLVAVEVLFGRLLGVPILGGTLIDWGTLW